MFNQKKYEKLIQELNDYQFFNPMEIFNFLDKVNELYLMHFERFNFLLPDQKDDFEKIDKMIQQSIKRITNLR